MKEEATETALREVEKRHTCHSPLRRQKEKKSFQDLLVQQMTESLETGEEIITRDVTVNPKEFA